MKKIEILESTLRDGSYAINFQFSARDTAVISKGLEDAGFRFIEIGHGIGLNASNSGKGQALESDEDYMKAAVEVLEKAKYGMFCIPGISRLEDIDLAAQYNMGFIRIGTNVTEIETSQKFIERAKKYGMYVSANFMKSYAIEPRKFAEQALKSIKYGADIICIVDSSGGMLPDELAGYINALKDAGDIPFGFHGHDNLGLANYHTIKSVEMGAQMVDTSLQGLGRSAGNASTEIVLCLLKRLGFETHINELLVMDIGEKYVKPLIPEKGLNSIDIISGFAQFHSSYMSFVKKFSSKYNIDPRELIVEICKQDKVNCDNNISEQAAKKVKKYYEDLSTSRFHLEKYHGDEQS